MPSTCTRNMVLGRASTTSPSTSIFSSFWAINLARRHEKTRLTPRPTMVAKTSKLPGSAFLHDFPVQFDAAAVEAHVLDDVPMDLAVVRSSHLGKAVAERQVDGAVDLLVEQRVLHVACDARVAADSELAEEPRSLVTVEDLVQERLVHLR